MRMPCGDHGRRADAVRGEGGRRGLRPRWPSWYERDRETIANALGATALSIDHVGSTSVPGLPAKPVIDILVRVPDAAAEPSYVPALEAAGCPLRLREPEWLEHRLHQRRGAPHDVNVHLFAPHQAAEEIDRMLTFGDWLRTHPADRDHHAATKRALSKKDWKYVQDYSDAKTEVTEQILAEAR